MKRFFGKLLIALGLLAGLTALLPPPTGRDTHFARMSQCYACAMAISLGTLLARPKNLRFE
jgi:hypothetical protein